MEMTSTLAHNRSNSTSSQAPLNIAGATTPARGDATPPEMTTAAGWINDRNFLLVVVTLITTLTYPMAGHPPGGSWQDDKDGPDGHVAGQPIIRDKARTVYFLLFLVNWLSFYNSLVLTVWLLTGVPPKDKRIRYSFLFSYTCLVFTYNLPLYAGHISDPFVISSVVLSLVTWFCFFAFAWSSIRSAT